VTRRSALLDVAVLALLLAYAVPFGWQLVTSFKPEQELLRVPPLLPSHVTLAHYGVVFTQSSVPYALLNSLGVAVLTTALACVLGVPAAYALATLRVPRANLLMLAIVASTAFPQIATVSPLYLVMRALGLRDTWAALVLADASFALPFVIWLMTRFMREVPRAVAEASALDGASRLRTLLSIYVPLTAPGLASAALLTFLFAWNEFLFAFTFTSTAASRTVPVALALFPGVFEVPWGDIAAASILASVPPVVIVVALQRWLVRGLLAGALNE
jgi:multiple sugar transport system permease protein